MSTSLDIISKELNISTDELINNGLLAYMEREIRLAEEDIADIRDKYFVATTDHLERKIKNKVIYSHPAWEDLAAWENAEAYIKKIKNTIEEVS